MSLEAIHLFVEILDHFFSNVCELDLVFNFHKAGPGTRPRRRAWLRCPAHVSVAAVAAYATQAGPWPDSTARPTGP